MLFDSILTSAAANAFAQRLRPGKSFSLGNLNSAAHPFIAALLRRQFPIRPILLITPDLKSQESFHADLATWLQAADLKTAPLFFPPWDILPGEDKLPHSDVISERLETLAGLWLATTPGESSALAPVVVTSVTALMQRTFAPEELQRRTRKLLLGDSLNPLDLIEWLEEQGYEPEAQVGSKGEIAWRGGIVDVWPLSSPWPLRLEFFGDTLDSIREFDPHAQTSRETVDQAILPPAGELALLRRPHPDAESSSNLPPSAPGTLLDHLPPGSILLLSEPDTVIQAALHLQQQVAPGTPFFTSWNDLLSAAVSRGLITCSLTELPEEPDPNPNSSTEPFPLPPMLSLDSYRPIGSTLPAPALAEVQRRDFFGQLNRWLRQGQDIRVFCNNEGEQQRLQEIWLEYGLDQTVGNENRTSPPALHSVLGSLSRGFLCPSARQVVVTDAEIFGRYKINRPRRLKSRHAASVRSVFDIDFSDFEEGDFVVHLEHGVGRYAGLKVLPPSKSRNAAAQGDGQECLVLEFAPREPGGEAPRLFVPVSEAHLISKYVGAGKARPQLNTLGGTRWAKAREHAEVAVRDLASQLLQVQAARTSHAGYAFPSDAPWQREFEGSFLFEETPDQFKAIEATKRDMENVRPMDRLICGDVGFGKTEVALRAVFKAVLAGKQVAILVPTTVLAQQHYQNFRERMAEYPVRIEVLSRLRKPAQIRETIDGIAAGHVDVVIGTHRLIQADVVFKDLGLVVVDEEQKFGVRHKEQFKWMRQTVDVITLSATPIPRTLYLALTGARDMSTLETPPQDRLPIETIVGNYDERVIRDAIIREMNRGGQIYFLHNRVATIENMGVRLKALVPDARILIGHGQMAATELEQVMTQFVSGDADVLLCTTIIESGLDIPNANTIIIDRADRFGLSELYQLRGRVGRYKHQAFAYLMLPRHARLLTEARKRMSAIKQYSSLGSGFRIALRDLELRGAGNLLGPQQSGHITAVGFDLYCQLLARSVSALKGELTQPKNTTRLRLDFLAMNPGEESQSNASKASSRLGAIAKPRIEIEIPREIPVYFSEESESRSKPPADTDRESMQCLAPTYLPLDYIREAGQRVAIYRKFAQIADAPMLKDLEKELRDRFGPLPPAVDRLLVCADLRLLAAARGISSLEVVDGKVKITRNGELITLNGQFPRLTRKESKARLNELKKLLLSIV
ncbi:MAG: transcription-repair coupling factor [Pedosphaera sp.]|nr:transcription-repair coupling factor [Pedosphaera sp.]